MAAIQTFFYLWDKLVATEFLDYKSTAERIQQIKLTSLLGQ